MSNVTRTLQFTAGQRSYSCGQNQNDLIMGGRDTCLFSLLKYWSRWVFKIKMIHVFTLCLRYWSYCAFRISTPQVFAFAQKDWLACTFRIRMMLVFALCSMHWSACAFRISMIQGFAHCSSNCSDRAFMPSLFSSLKVLNRQRIRDKYDTLRSVLFA